MQALVSRVTIGTLFALLAAMPAVSGAQRRGMDASDVMRLKVVGTTSMSPDGGKVLYTVSGWEHPNARGDTALGDRHERRSHVFMVSHDGGAVRQLTYGERGESQPAWSPDGRTISFVAARGSGTGEDAPRSQIWLLPADGGEARQLTRFREGVASYVWSPDGKSIAVVAADTITREEEARRRRRDDSRVFESDFRMNHIWTVDAATGDASRITSGNFTVTGVPSWSPDGRQLVFLSSPTPMARDERRLAQIVDVATRQLTPINADGDVQTSPQFSPDGKLIAFTLLPRDFPPKKDGIPARTQRNSRIVTYHPTSQSFTNHASANFDFSPGQLRWSPDGRELWFTTSDRVYQSLFSFDLSSGKYTRRTRDTLIGGLSWSSDGKRFAFTLNTPQLPAEVFVQDGFPGTPRRVSDTNPWIAERELGAQQVVTWKSKDGKEVEGVLLLPVGYQQGQKVPLVVSAHGGPTSAHVNSFRLGTDPGQTWAARGWAVLYPNPRGSTGYGEAWMRANMGDWGGGDYRDIMTGVDELIRRGIADSTRMAFEGWSYGGYMTSWVVSQTGRFKAAMMGAGLPDLLSMNGTTDIPGYINTFFDAPQFDGTLVNASIRKLLERSAISYSDRVTTPLLMLHGSADERVPIGQPMEFYRALKDRGKTVELVFYPREGHGFSEYYHQLDRMQREYDWIARHTLGARQVPSMQ